MSGCAGIFSKSFLINYFYHKCFKYISRAIFLQKDDKDRNIVDRYKEFKLDNLGSYDSKSFWDEEIKEIEDFDRKGGLILYLDNHEM